MGITCGLAEVGVAAGLDAVAAIALPVGLAALAGFVVHALRAERPLLDLGLTGGGCSPWRRSPRSRSVPRTTAG
ncbi:hypothetical protein [Umezawaea tangerina]|uniref:hypothetical protein n=1 Tax=Umezawaea tangerina TaxID=84725 RepID=UPI000D07CE8F|nr:hypothetical protein [Umezawaea tangerina]